MIVAGVDPGAKWVAYVVADLAASASMVLEFDVWERDRGEDVYAFARRVGDLIGASVAEWADGQPDPLLVGLEGMNSPTPHLGMTQVRHIVETFYVLGYLEAAVGWAGGYTVIVPPGRHGTGLLAAYPDFLVGARETTGTGKSKWQHLRAAWDVAHAAEGMANMRGRNNGV